MSPPAGLPQSHVQGRQERATATIAGTVHCFQVPAQQGASKAGAPDSGNPGIGLNKNLSFVSTSSMLHKA